MPNVRISDLPPATLPLTGDEILETTQLERSRKVSVSDLITSVVPTSAAFVLLGNDPLLPNGRDLDVVDPILLTDGGPGGNVTLSIPDGAIQNIKLADMSEGTIKGRAAGTGLGPPVDLSVSEVVEIVLPPDPGQDALLLWDDLIGSPVWTFEIADSFLSDNVALEDALNVFTVRQQVNADLVVGPSANQALITHYGTFSSTGANYVRIAENDAAAGRGGCRIWISGGGGAVSPCSLMMTVHAGFNAVPPVVTVVGTDHLGASVLTIRSGFDVGTNNKYIDVLVQGIGSYSVAIESFGIGSGNQWRLGSFVESPPIPSSTYEIAVAGVDDLAFGVFSHELHSLAYYDTLSGNAMTLQSTGDVVLNLIADTVAPGAETNNPWIFLSQDQGAVTSLFGLVGDVDTDPQGNVFTGLDQNGLAIRQTFATSCIGLGVGLSVALRVRSDDVQVLGGKNFSILNSTGANRAEFNHDGLDLNTVFIGTTQWNITGLPFLDASLTDADFDALTATSYGGILEVNLLDKTAAEVISGDYKFNQGGNNFLRGGIDNTQNFALLFGFNYDSAINPIIRGFGGTSVSTPGQLQFSTPTTGDFLFSGGPVSFNVDVTINEGNTLTLQSTNDGDILLDFATDRGWRFEQSGIDSAASLRLINYFGGGKSFHIGEVTGGANFTFFTNSAVATAFFQLNADNSQLRFGAGNDMQLFSDGVNGHIVSPQINLDGLVNFPSANTPPAANVSRLTQNMLFLDGKETIDGVDAFLRLNQNGEFTSGTYTPGHLRVDGGITSGAGTVGAGNIRATGSVQADVVVIAGVGSAGGPSFSFIGDPDNGMYRPATNILGLSAAGIERMRFFAPGTGNTSAAQVKDHGNNLRDVGFNVLPPFQFNATDTLEAQHCGAIWGKDDGLAKTLTLASNVDLDFPVNGIVTIINANTTAILTITEGASTTLFYLDGATRTDTAGGCTIGPGGFATIWRQSATVYYIWGAGITP